MSDSVLTILKFCLLALLYLFLIRVVFVVVRELRGTPEPVPVPAVAPAPATAAAPKRREWKLVVVEPPAERGKAFVIKGEATIGRGGGCTVPLSFDTFVSQVHARARRPRRQAVDRRRRLDERHDRERRQDRTSERGRQGRSRAGRRDVARGRPVKLAAAVATDTGQVRTNNEDSFLIDDVRALFAVADGMGGHRGGETASRTAIESLRASIASGTELSDAIVRANTAVIEKAAGDDELTGMGTTLTAIIVAGPQSAPRGARRRLARVPVARRDDGAHHRGPQPRRGARARRPAHTRAGGSAPAARRSSRGRSASTPRSTSTATRSPSSAATG